MSERKNILTALKLLQSFLRCIRNVEVYNFLPKDLFSFTLEAVLKMEKITTNKGGIESMCAQVNENPSNKMPKLDITSK